MSESQRDARARHLFLPDFSCLARRARCNLAPAYVSLRPCHIRRRPPQPPSDPLARFLDFARDLAARLWSLID